MAENPYRVALIGTGFIASVHLQALARCPGVSVVALCDSALEKARSMAKAHGIERVHGSIAELLEVGGIDAAHVLVPPDYHREVAEVLLRGGVHVLVEKPLALTTQDIADLRAAAGEHGRALAVNHNMVFHPCVTRLVKDVREGKLGRLEHVDLVHNVPVRQLDSGDVSHFMFQSEANILLEQAVHPLSVIQRLLGPCLDVNAAVGPPRQLSNGSPFYDTWRIGLRCERGTAQLFLAFGRTLQENTMHAICSDGSVRADLNRAQYVRSRKTRWLDFWDSASNSLGAGFGLIRQGFGVASDYGLGLFKIVKLPDSFLRSMGASIGAFYDALRSGEPQPNSGLAAEQVVEMVERIATAAGVSWERHPRFAPPVQPPPARPGEIVVTGATGFLGRYVIPALKKAGRPITVLVRKPEFTPEFLRDPDIRVMVGDARDRTAVQRAVAGAEAVLHMATCPPGAGETPIDSMTDGARAVAEACLEENVKRLVFASSTAALYLGDPTSITGAAPPDPRSRTRAEYSRGKIEAENTLRQVLQGRELELVILRPAIVVGEGGQINHSGVGLWVRDNHCVGWGMGNNALPFVLASDCADAMVQSLLRPEAAGKSYNLAGDVRPSAAEFISEMRRRLGRDFHFHPQPIWSMVAIEAGKWLVKVLARKKGGFPQGRDFRSRGFFTNLDCSDAKADLGWEPVSDRATFYEAAIPTGTPEAEAKPVPSAADVH